MLRSLLVSGSVLLTATSVVFAQPNEKEKATPPVTAIVESTMATDGGKVRQFAFDGSADTYYASTKPPTVTDHFTLTFDQPVKVKSITVLTGKPKGGDELTAGVLEVSADGKAFESLTTFADGKATATPGKSFLAVRVKATGEEKAPLTVREFTLDTDPKVTTFKNPVEIVTDATDAPELKEWLEKAARVCEKQYPMICEELKGDGYTPPTRITMTLKKDYDGVAYAAGTRIVGSVKYYTGHKDDVGSLIHETAHSVQQYRGRGNPGWLVEGVADYVRFFKYEAKKPAKLAPEKAKYNGSYRTTAAFLAYLSETHDKEIVRKLNDTMRRGKYTDGVWKDLTGKTVEEPGRSPGKYRMSSPVLAVADVRKRFGRFPALNGVSFDVQPGELFGLLGPNGAGKTTLMSILAGLTAATSGEVRLFGQRFTTDDRDARRRIGLATQDLSIYPDLTARENLLFFGKLYGMRGHDLTGRVNEMLDAVGLTDRANDRAGTFSGGMKRRLNLAAAVIHRPNLLLLDEPTTGVDPQSRNHIFDQVRAQNAAGMTVIYTSHYMEEVQALCPRIAILDGGKLQACDTLPHLLARLEASAKLTLSAPPADLVERVRSLPGVTGAMLSGAVLTVTTRALPPLLPKLLTMCGEVTALEIEQPTLERVFLSLTGRALRD